MVERFIKLQQPVCAALIELQRQDLMPQDNEVSTLEVYRAVMEPLAEITDSIGGEKHITFSAVRPLIYKLYNSYLKVNTSDASVGKEMKTVMCTKLLQYYNSETLGILNITALLDPRFKSLSFLEEVEKVSTRLNVQEKICSLLLESNSTSDDTSGPEAESTNEIGSSSTGATDVIDVTPAAKRKKKQSKFMELLSDMMSSVGSSRDQSVEDRAKSELLRYMEDSSYDGTVTLLQWWHQNKQRYPSLCKLALQYLTIPATSVPSERAFSISGHIVRAKRACLLPENVQMLVFLAENLP